MKKATVILILILMISLFTACSQSDKASDSSKDVEESEKKTTKVKVIENTTTEYVVEDIEEKETEVEESEEQEPACEGCRYLKEGKCVRYNCCADDDCIQYTDKIGTCSNPGTKEALCQYKKYRPNTQEECTGTTCFMDAIEDCDPAEMDYLHESEDSGIIEKITVNLELRGYDGAKCTYIQKITGVEYLIKVSNAGIFQETGMTQEEAQEEMGKLQDESDEFMGERTECLMPEKDIEDMIDDWKDGKSSPKDIALDGCPE